MTLRDFMHLSLGNLFRMKLRSLLTISGVLIAIAAFVSMVSFGAGNQARIQEQFHEFGLFGTMIVYPPADDDSLDVKLDDSALLAFQQFPDVNLVYPYSRFSTSVAMVDTQFSRSAQAIPIAAFNTPLLSRFIAGRGFSSDTAREIVIDQDLIADLDIDSADNIVGDTLILSVKVATLDSALGYAFKDIVRSITQQSRHFDFDSIRNQDYVMKMLREELSGTVARFMDGFMEAKRTIADTLIVVGVLKDKQVGHRAQSSSLLIPLGTARLFDTAGFSGDATTMVSAMRSGRIFGASGTSAHYDRVTIDFDPMTNYDSLKAPIEEMGFRTFSYAEEFEEIRRFFLYFNLALGMIGLIALSTASLGIVNTMVMAILERKREIGVMKSLGADERDIKRLFLAESAAIGAIGAIAGIFVGWLITRGVSAIAKAFMRSEGFTPVELFALPWWLILTAFSIGFLVALVAGFYPARRAARVDPVEALRNE